MVELLKRIEIVGMNQHQIAKTVLEALILYGKNQSQDGISNKRDQNIIQKKLNGNEMITDENLEQIRSFIIESGLIEFRQGYVVLKNEDKQLVVYLKLYSDKCMNVMEDDEFQDSIEELKSKVKRIKKEDIIIIGYTITSEEDHWTEPFGIDKEGKVYQLFDVVKLRQCDSFLELFEKHVEYEQWNQYKEILVYQNDLKYDADSRAYIGL